MAEKDYADIMFDAVSVLIDKKIEAVKFDQTINATIVDATKAEEGAYVVSTGNAKFTAYSTEVEYKENDAVLVMIPQGNYDNQKMIIGKQVKDDNSPLVYRSPFQQLVNMTNNLIFGEKNIAYWANHYEAELTDDVYEKGRPWDIGTSDFKNSDLYKKVLEIDDFISAYNQNNNPSNEDQETYRNYQNLYKNIVVWDSYSEQISSFYQGYTRIGLSAQFATWLSDYNTVSGNYGLALEITFKSLEIPDPVNIGDPINTFKKIITFDSDNFFGNVYGFESYYTQENVYDISEYANFPITRIRLFAYQRNNFFSGSGEKIPHNSPDSFGSINPNIFITNPYICLGIASSEFTEDMVTILTKDTLTYEKGVLPTTQEANDNFYEQRMAKNKKTIGVRWIHKDVDKDIIKAVEPEEFPDYYEVRWYRYRLGSPSPDQFAGSHWQRIQGYENPPSGARLYPEPNADGNYYDVNNSGDIFTDRLEQVFFPNINMQTEQIKVIIVKNDGDDNNPIYRLIASSNILEFINQTEVRNQASIIDMNALSIQFVNAAGEQADCLGNYFLYDKSDRILNEGNKEIRFLKLVFDEYETNVYAKNDLILDRLEDNITWYFPVGSDTMIIPAKSAQEPESQIDTPNTADGLYYSVSGKEYSMMAFFIKEHLNRYAGRNTVKAEVIKDGATYTAEAQMNFGTSGTSGSDYTITIVWKDGKNALDVSDLTSDRAILEGEAALFDQNGQRVQLDTASNKWEMDWLVEENTASDQNQLEFAKQTSNFYYPIYFNENFVTFKSGQQEDGLDDQRNGQWYYYLLSDIFTQSILDSSGGLQFNNGLTLSIKTNGWATVYSKLQEIFVFDEIQNNFVNCINFYNKINPTNKINATTPPNPVNNFISCLIVNLEETNIYHKYRQLYKRSKNEKRALIFDPLQNIYNGSQNDETFYLSSINSEEVFFKNNMILQDQSVFYNLVQNKMGISGAYSSFLSSLQKFVKQYAYSLQEISVNTSGVWKICIGQNANNTLFSSLDSERDTTSSKIFTIKLYKILTDNQDNLYYNNGNGSFSKININNLSNANEQILVEFYCLLYNKLEVTLEGLQREYLFRLLKDPNYQIDDVTNEPRTITLGEDYAYQINGGEIFFIAANQELDFETLSYFFENDNIVFYKFQPVNNSSSILNTLKRNFGDDVSSISWENILCRIIDYGEKTLSEIQSTILPTYYLINNQSLKEYVYNKMTVENNTRQQILQDLISNNSLNFQELRHDENGLNNCLLTGILQINNSDGFTGNSPGFQKNANYESIINKAKPKFFLEQMFKQRSDIVKSAMELLQYIRSGKMNNFTYLKNDSNINITDQDGVAVVGRNPNYNSQGGETDEYANILYQLSTILKDNEAELLSNIEEANLTTAYDASSIAKVETHINQQNQSFEDADYVYGKFLFASIKEFFNNASGSKKILKSSNNLSRLFKLIYTAQFYDDLKDENFNISFFEDDLPFFETSTERYEYVPGEGISNRYALYSHDYLTQDIIRDTTPLTNAERQELNRLGTFQLSTGAYYTGFKENLSNQIIIDNTSSLLKLFRYCVEREIAAEELHLDSGCSLVSIDGLVRYEEEDLPTGCSIAETMDPQIIIDTINKTITYEGSTACRIEQENTSDGSISYKTVILRRYSSFPRFFQDYFLRIIPDEDGIQQNEFLGDNYFNRSTAVGLRTGYNIIHFYNYYRRDEYNITGRGSPLSYKQLTASTIINSNNNDNIECTIAQNLEEVVIENKATVQCKKSNGSSFGSLSQLNYRYLCSKYYPNNGGFPDFVSLLTFLLIKIWQTTSDNSSFLYIFSKSGFPYYSSYVKAASGNSSENTFGYSDDTTLIFLPYSAYSGFKYKSINQKLRECVITSSGDRRIDMSAVKAVINSLTGNTVMILDDDKDNLFFTMLMKLLFKNNYQNVDSLITDQNKFLLQVLTSDIEIFWKCFNFISNVTYPTENSSGKYYFYSTITQQLDDSQNVYKDFKQDIEELWSTRDQTLPNYAQVEDLKNKIFNLFKEYFARQNFYQLQSIANTTQQERNEKIANYLSGLWFKKSLDIDLYIQSYYNVENENSQKQSFLKYLYLDQPFEDLVSTENLTALAWLQKILTSKEIVPYAHSFKNNSLNYYTIIDGERISIQNYFSNHRYENLQKLYSKIIYSSFYSLQDKVNNVKIKDLLITDLISDSVNPDSVFYSLIPKKRKEILLGLISPFFTASVQSDVAYYGNLISLDFSENFLYYKIINEDTNQVAVLFSSSTTDKIKILQELYKMQTQKVQFYNKNQNVDNSTVLYFNYYNSAYKKAFIKRNGQFILDPSETYNPIETYYQPLQSLKKVNKYAALKVENGLDQSPIFQISPINNRATSEGLLNSLYILRISLTHFGDYKLTACFPIPFKNGTVVDSNTGEITYQVKYIEGATEVWYPMTNSPEYHQNPYRIYISQLVEENGQEKMIINEEKTDVVWEVFYSEADNFIPTLSEDPPILKPVSIFVRDASNYGIKCYAIARDDNTGDIILNNETGKPEKGIILWSQAIYVYQDRYPSTTVNKWNGTGIEMDKDKGIILAAAFAAGKKEEDNSFSGVMIGSWENDDAQEDLKEQTGVYGFSHGETSYGFKEDGTAFIGKQSRGRIYFDGNRSQIYSANWKGDENLGMLLDLDDGYIKLYGTNVPYTLYNPSVTVKDETTQEMNYELGETNQYASNAYITIDSGLYDSDHRSATRKTNSGQIVPRNNSSWAMAIGTTESEGSRELRIGWGGDIHIDRGYLKGSVIEGSLITSANVFTNYLQSGNGWISGWLLKSKQIQSPPMNRSGSESTKSWTILHPINGITTNQIKISTISEIKNNETSGEEAPEVSGYLGYLKGNNGVSETDAIGLYSEANTVIVQTKKGNIGIKAKDTTGSVYVEAQKTLSLRYQPVDDKSQTGQIHFYTSNGKHLDLEMSEGDIRIESGNKIEIQSTDISLQSSGGKVSLANNQLTVTFAAESQVGIYARFG